jgi:hypothetical protein
MLPAEVTVRLLLFPLAFMLRQKLFVAASRRMTCFKLAIDETAVALPAVQFEVNEEVRIWSNGLGPFTDMAQSALQRERRKRQIVGVM